MATRASYGLKKQRSSRCLGRQCTTLYKPHVGPTLTHGSEIRTLKRKDKNMLRFIESRTFRRICGPITEYGICKSSYNHELYELCDEPYIVKVIKVGRLRWLGHLFRMQEQNPCRKLNLHKPESTRQVRTSAVRWLESDEDDMKTMGVRNWRQKSQHHDQWTAIANRPRFIMDSGARRRIRRGKSYFHHYVDIFFS